MSRGGQRSGAGRKRKAIKPSVDFQLLDRLRDLPGDNAIQRRIVLALACYGAPVPEIAAVLDIDERGVRATYHDELETGQVLIKANAVVRLWEKAQSGSVQSLMWLARRTDLTLEVNKEMTK